LVQLSIIRFGVQAISTTLIQTPENPSLPPLKNNRRAKKFQYNTLPIYCIVIIFIQILDKGDPLKKTPVRF